MKTCAKLHGKGAEERTRCANRGAREARGVVRLQRVTVLVETSPQLNPVLPSPDTHLTLLGLGTQGHMFVGSIANYLFFVNCHINQDIRVDSSSVLPDSDRNLFAGP